MLLITLIFDKHYDFFQAKHLKNIDTTTLTSLSNWLTKDPKESKALAAINPLILYVIKLSTQLIT